MIYSDNSNVTGSIIPCISVPLCLVPALSMKSTGRLGREYFSCLLLLRYGDPALSPSKHPSSKLIYQELKNPGIVMDDEEALQVRIQVRGESGQFVSVEQKMIGWKNKKFPSFYCLLKNLRF